MVVQLLVMLAVLDYLLAVRQSQVQVVVASHCWVALAGAMSEDRRQLGIGILAVAVEVTVVVTVVVTVRAAVTTTAAARAVIPTPHGRCRWCFTPTRWYAPYPHCVPATLHTLDIALLPLPLRV